MKEVALACIVALVVVAIAAMLTAAFRVGDFKERCQLADGAVVRGAGNTYYCIDASPIIAELDAWKGG